mmetsp:Transcript_4042/g.4473  ORF Transcript_4042/g.4473 Transcript_4042/m.4473 type:complete len:84 (+) Transcript_4042:1976-2227(+)
MTSTYQRKLKVTKKTKNIITHNKQTKNIDYKLQFQSVIQGKGSEQNKKTKTNILKGITVPSRNHFQTCSSQEHSLQRRYLLSF